MLGPVEKAEPLPRLAAKNHFWDMGIADLKLVAKHLGIELPAKASLSECLIAMTMSILECSEDGAFTYLAPRLFSKHAVDQGIVSELLELDEASKLLTREDEEELHKEQKRQHDLAERESDFKQDFKERRKAHRASAKVKPKKQKQLVMPPAEEINHERAKKLLPPDSYIWRAFSANAWQGRCPPANTVSRGWKENPGEALRELLVILWEQWCSKEGVHISDCPMQGLVSDRSAGSSSSSAG